MLYCYSDGFIVESLSSAPRGESKDRPAPIQEDYEPQEDDEDGVIIEVVDSDGTTGNHNYI